MASDLPRANLQPLSLYVPEPKFRPGDTVDFTQVAIPPAGDVRRPDTADHGQRHHARSPDEDGAPARVVDHAERLVVPARPRALTG